MILHVSRDILAERGWTTGVLERKDGTTNFSAHIRTHRVWVGSSKGSLGRH